MSDRGMAIVGMITERMVAKNKYITIVTINSALIKVLITSLIELLIYFVAS